MASKGAAGRLRPILGLLAGVAFAALLIKLGAIKLEFARKTLPPEYLALPLPPPRMTGRHPCVYQSLTEEAMSPRMGECGMLTLTPVTVDRFEVDLRYGNFMVRQTDLFLKDQIAVAFTRTYNSGDWIDPNLIHAFGRNTNHPYDIALLGKRNPYTELMIVLEDGDFVYTDRISSGTDYSDAVFRHTETSGQFYGAITYWNWGGWTTRLRDGSVILFPEAYWAKRMADGAPYEIDDAQGNKLLLKRDAKRNLQEIRTPHGHAITLSYDSSGLVRRAQDDAGNWVSYQYGAGSTLVAVRASSGKKRYYEYEGALITAVRDEHGTLLVKNSYDERKLVAQEFSGGRVCRYSYRWARAGTYADDVMVRLPDGHREEVNTSLSVSDFLRRPR